MWAVLGTTGLLLAVFLNSPAYAAKDDRGEAKLTLSGKNISIDYGRPSTKGKGYQSMDKIAEGFSWRMGRNEATKLEMDGDLKFGDQVIKAGKYSLVAKKTKDGWNLLVHPNADRWGTPVPEDGYVGNPIPLKASELKDEVELLTIKLEEKDGEGVFTLDWGKQELSAKFKIAG
jgi:hypothetical protein